MAGRSSTPTQSIDRRVTRPQKVVEWTDKEGMKSLKLSLIQNMKSAQLVKLSPILKAPREWFPGLDCNLKEKRELESNPHLAPRRPRPSHSSTLSLSNLPPSQGGRKGSLACQPEAFGGRAEETHTTQSRVLKPGGLPPGALGRGDTRFPRVLHLHEVPCYGGLSAHGHHPGLGEPDPV